MLLLWSIWGWDEYWHWDMFELEAELLRCPKLGSLGFEVKGRVLERLFLFFSRLVSGLA